MLGSIWGGTLWRMCRSGDSNSPGLKRRAVVPLEIRKDLILRGAEHSEFQLQLMACVQHLGKPTPKSMSVIPEFKWVELRRLKNSGDF